MTRVTISFGEHTLEIHREMIPVTSISELDPNWRYTDRAGHVHRPSVTRELGKEDKITGYPTLEWFPEDHECNRWCDEEGCPRWRACPRCGEKITPGSRAGRTRMLAGMVSYEIDGEPVSPTAARDFVTNWQREFNARHGHDAAYVSELNLSANRVKGMIEGA